MRDSLGDCIIHLRLAGINRNAPAILCTTGDDVSNVYITLTGRQLNPNTRIISRAYRHDNLNSGGIVIVMGQPGRSRRLRAQ
jgi:Trk K+ transport system NAD-binding subunit